MRAIEIEISRRNGVDIALCVREGLKGFIEELDGRDVAGAYILQHP